MAHPFVQYRNSSGDVATVEFWRNPVNGHWEASVRWPGRAYFGAGDNPGSALRALFKVVREDEDAGYLVRVRKGENDALSHREKRQEVSNC
jgi:hypothetical protein